MAKIVGGAAVSTSASVPGGPIASVYAPLPAAGLAVSAGQSTQDTGTTATATGRRFYVEYRYAVSNIQSYVGSGMVPSAGTVSSLYVELEYNGATTGQVALTRHMASWYATQPSTLATTATWQGSASANPGPVIFRWWADFTASTTITFTPLLYLGTATTLYYRNLRVDTLA